MIHDTVKKSSSFYLFTYILKHIFENNYIINYNNK